jgi:general nucleoside transport system permease protein
MSTLATNMGVTIMASAVRIAMPLVLAALGEIFAERSGVLNLGVEGMMLVGAGIGFTCAVAADSLWLGMLTGVICGILLSMLFAYFAVYLRADQTVCGLSLWILGGGIASFVFRVAFGKRGTFPTLKPFAPVPLPGLSKIPVLGPILFNQNVLVYLTMVAIPVVWIIIGKTEAGLRIRSVGEQPKAAATLGINVLRTRFWAVVIGGAFAGAAGASIPLGSLGTFMDDVTASRGFIAIAIVIFSRWNPLAVPVGALFFGAMDALQNRLQVMGSPVPYQLLVALPYLATILVLVLFHVFRRGKQTIGPASLTIPYEG